MAEVSTGPVLGAYRVEGVAGDGGLGRVCRAMRWLEGTDLLSLISREGRPPAGRAVAIVGQIAAALDAAHSGGLVRRDVKPANLLR